MKLLFGVALAGAAGTLIRWGAVRLVDYCAPGFPWGTFAVNFFGALLAGFCFVWCRRMFPQYALYFPVLFVGFFGAFTTFSTFALESARFLSDGRYALLALNLLLQNCFGIAAALGGMLLARCCFR